MQVGITGVSNEKAKDLIRLILESKDLYISGLNDCGCSGLIGSEIYGQKISEDILDLFASSDVVVDMSSHQDKSKELVLAAEMETKYIIFGEVEETEVFKKASSKGSIKCCDDLNSVMSELNG